MERERQWNYSNEQAEFHFLSIALASIPFDKCGTGYGQREVENRKRRCKDGFQWSDVRYSYPLPRCDRVLEFERF
jgi:hypothetical protein